MWDRRLDRRVERTAGRPLAAGTVSVLQAWCFVALLCAIGLAILVQLPLTAILTGIAALPLVILYPLAKRVTWWPQAVLGLTFHGVFRWDGRQRPGAFPPLATGGQAF